MSRAAKIRWRKVDVSATEQLRENAEKAERIEAKLVEGPLFEIVTTPAPLSKRLAKELANIDPKGNLIGGFDSYKPHKRRQIEKTQKGLDQRKRELEKYRRERNEEKQVFDAWDDSTVPLPVKKLATVFPRPEIVPPSAVPAVKLPHAGQSYNAKAEDLLAAIFEATNAEIAIIEKTEMRELEEIRGEELVKLIAPKDDKSEGGNSADEDEEAIERKEPHYKTRQQRMRLSKHRRLQDKLARATRNKKLLKSVETLPAIRKELSLKEAKAAEQRRQREGERLAKLAAEAKGIVRPFKIGKSKFLERPIEVNPRDLTASSLRAMKVPDSSAMIFDRFLSAKRRRLAVGQSNRARN